SPISRGPCHSLCALVPCSWLSASSRSRGGQHRPPNVSVNIHVFRLIMPHGHGACKGRMRVPRPHCVGSLVRDEGRDVRTGQVKQIDRAVRINGSRERNERSMTNGMTGPNAMADMNRTAGTNGGAGAGAHARAGSGRQIRISGGGYTAEIASVGATLRSLSHRDRPLTATFGADEVRPAALGTGLLQWPNRIAGGAYEFA